MTMMFVHVQHDDVGGLLGGAARAAAIATSRLGGSARCRLPVAVPAACRQAVKSFPTTIVMSPIPDGTWDTADAARPRAPPSTAARLLVGRPRSRTRPCVVHVEGLRVLGQHDAESRGDDAAPRPPPRRPGVSAAVLHDDGDRRRCVPNRSAIISSSVLYFGHDDRVGHRDRSGIVAASRRRAAAATGWPHAVGIVGLGEIGGHQLRRRSPAAPRARSPTARPASSVVASQERLGLGDPSS